MYVGREGERGACRVSDRNHKSWILPHVLGTTSTSLVPAEGEPHLLGQ